MLAVSLIGTGGTPVTYSTRGTPGTYGCITSFSNIVCLWCPLHCWSCLYLPSWWLYNEIRDIIAQLMSLRSVLKWPLSQLFSQLPMNIFHRSASGAYLDVRAQGFGGIHYTGYIESPDFFSTCFKSHDWEMLCIWTEMKWHYFTFFVFSALGGASRPTEITYDRLTSLHMWKKINITLLFLCSGTPWIFHCFSLPSCVFGAVLQLAICIEISISIDFTLAASEGRLSLTD